MAAETMTKRRHMPVSVQLHACLILLGFNPDEPIEWHHSIPLSHRPILADGRYEPDENDPRYIVPMQKAEHRERTAKIDVPIAAKIKRLSKKQEAFRGRLLAKQTGDDPPRDVRKHRIQSRPFNKPAERRT